LADGALAYFGYPEAHEDDAERAVRAGLAAIQAVASLSAPCPSYRPALRIGVATGLVVVGDQATSSGAVEHILAGEAPHLAARLRTEAAAGEVLVSACKARAALPAVSTPCTPFAPIWSVARRNLICC